MTHERRWLPLVPDDDKSPLLRTGFNDKTEDAGKVVRQNFRDNTWPAWALHRAETQLAARLVAAMLGPYEPLRAGSPPRCLTRLFQDERQTSVGGFIPRVKRPKHRLCCGTGFLLPTVGAREFQLLPTAEPRECYLHRELAGKDRLRETELHKHTTRHTQTVRHSKCPSHREPME